MPKAKTFKTEAQAFSTKGDRH